jgi:hypothetical protein
MLGELAQCECRLDRFQIESRRTATPDRQVALRVRPFGLRLCGIQNEKGSTVRARGVDQNGEAGSLSANDLWRIGLTAISPSFRPPLVDRGR